MTKAVTVQSVNGPGATVIEGSAGPYALNGVRCVFLTNGAALHGFTLTNGAGGLVGAGVWCLSTNALVSSCVIVGNTNGGAFSGTLNHCRLLNNRAFYLAGGALASTLNNCLLAGNMAAGGGGASGAAYCVANNCTIVGNMASGGGGGAYSTLNNCIVYYNTAFPRLANDYYSCSLNHCCTTPLPADGVGNFTNEPAFLSLELGDLRLQRNSPCIDAGDNAHPVGATDLDGQPRMVGGTVDIGAYEFQGPVLVPWPPALSNGVFRVSVATLLGKSYLLGSKDSLTEQSWKSLQAVAGDGTVKVLADMAATVSQRFYRLRVE